MAGRAHCPSGSDWTLVTATESRTRRSTRTVAPGTGPPGPSTEPDRLAPPGPTAPVRVVGVRGFPGTVTSTVVVVVEDEVGGGGVFVFRGVSPEPPPLH